MESASARDLKLEAGLESFSQHVLLVQGSGRNWKEPSQRASSVKNPILTSSWEKKMQQKAAHQRYKEVKQAAIDVRKQKLQVCAMPGTAQCSSGRRSAAQQQRSHSGPTLTRPTRRFLTLALTPVSRTSRPLLECSYIIWDMQCCCTSIYLYMQKYRLVLAKDPQELHMRDILSLLMMQTRGQT